MEIFRTIKNYEGLYEVSNLGNVKSVERNYEGGFGAICHTGGKLLKLNLNKKRQNRVQVVLSKEGKAKTHFVSILVAQAFPEICGEWFEGCEVDHIDTNVTNNVATNLRCVTKSENMRNPLTRKHLSDGADRVARSERMKGDKNPAKHYTEEWRKHLSEATKGKPNFKCWKPVIITKDSEEIFCNSLTEAAKYIGNRTSDIGSVLKGRQKTTHGWKVKYVNI